MEYLSIYVNASNLICKKWAYSKSLNIYKNPFKKE